MACAHRLGGIPGRTQEEDSVSESSQSQPGQREGGLDPLAGILALIVPGLGYLPKRERARAAGVFIGVFGLFFGGVLIGGVSAVDRETDRLWFFAQAGIGAPAFALDALNDSTFKVQPAIPGPPNWGHPNPELNMNNVAAPAKKSIGRVRDTALLWTALAGMLNLIAVVDCLFSAPGARSSKP